MEERIQRTMKALERNKIKPYYVETREQLYDLVRELVKNDADNRRRLHDA